jgi:hypothetical protein
MKTSLSNVNFFMDLISFGLDEKKATLETYGPGEPRVHGMKKRPTELCFSAEDLRVKKLYEILGRNSR